MEVVCRSDSSAVLPFLHHMFCCYVFISLYLLCKAILTMHLKTTNCILHPKNQCFRLKSMFQTQKSPPLYRGYSTVGTFLDGYSIWISAQPQISTQLECAPILKAEKVNKHPASNKVRCPSYKSVRWERVDCTNLRVDCTNLDLHLNFQFMSFTCNKDLGFWKTAHLPLP